MATTSIWRVKGWLSKVLIYAENPDKTENPAFFEFPGVSEDGLQKLDDVIAYAAHEDKTEKHHYVSGVNVNPNIARDEMMEVKRKFEKAEGTVAYHGYQSFAPGETDPKIAHEIGVKLAERLWGKDFQVLIATHTDRDHIHNHFIVNSVSMVDGHKFYRSEGDYWKMRRESDVLCREAGLSVIKNPREGGSKHYVEWKAEKENKHTWRSLIKADVDEAIANATSTRQFFDNLKHLGYEVKLGKDISVRPPGKERYFRLQRNFGDDYAEEAIRRRALSQMTPRLGIPKTASRTTVKPELARVPKGTLVGLYRHYCYIFGIYQRKENNNRMPFALREELRYFDQITEDAKLLNRTDIKTTEELTTFTEGLEEDIALLVKERRQIKASDQSDSRRALSVTASTRIDEINEALKAKRKEVRQCKRIVERSEVLAKKLPHIEPIHDEKTRKEVRGHGRNQPGNRLNGKDRAARH